MIDSMAPACGTPAPCGAAMPNLWITDPDVDNCAVERPPVGEGVVGGGRIFCAVRFSGLTSRARARSPIWQQVGGRTGSGGPRGFLYSRGPDAATGTRANGHPAASDKTEQRVRGSRARTTQKRC